jgi:glutamate decarboxylase
VPAYPMPAGMEDVHVLRVVVRNGFSRDMAELLVRDLRAVVERLERVGGDVDAGDRTGFHH